jgi:uncharacterized membrane protein YoaK (UPF0700 family)
MAGIDRRGTLAFAVGIAAGVVLGTLVGYALGDLALWPLVGLLCGTGVGVVLEAWMTPSERRASGAG